MKKGISGIILKQTGRLLMALGIVIAVPSLVSMLYSEWWSALGFLISALITSGTGFILFRIFVLSDEPRFVHAMLLAAFGWLMMTILGGLPFFIIAYITPDEAMKSFIPDGVNYTDSSLIYFKNYLHCFFESMSAYTTTGLSMAVHEPSVGKGVLFYRSFANWIGGAGFIVMALAIFKQVPGRSAIMLYSSESSNKKLKHTVVGTARAIWKLYLYITLLMTVYLIIGTYLILPDYPISENIFDSVNHAMSGQSTGGFSTLDDSIATYHSQAMDFLYLLPMIIGSFSFMFYFRIFDERKFSEVWKDIQTRFLLIAFFFGGIILSVLLYFSNDVSDPVREGIFQFISGMSTTGWQTSNIGKWDDYSIVFIVFAGMFIGGASGATVGGIKVIRALLIVKGIRWQVNKVFFTERTIKTIHFNGKRLLPDEMNEELAKVSIFTLSYIILLFACTFISMFFINDGFTFADALFESASAQSTVGLSSGITDPSMSPVVEVMYIFQMWLGRLEIIPVFALIRAIIWGINPKVI